MARWPTDFPKATPHGKYGQVRSTPDDGACGVSNYPCVHPGLDLAGPKGTEVYAPEEGIVDTTSRGLARPFRHFDPGIIVFKGRSGVYHWLAHLQYETIPSATVPGSFWDYATTPLYKSTDQRRELHEGQLVGLTGDPDHVHWEIHVGRWNGPRMSPAEWLLRQGVGLDLSQYQAKSGPVGDDGGMWLWLLAGYLLLEH